MHVHAGDLRNAKTSRLLRISLGVTLVYIVLLVVFGLRAHSLALLSEAGHNLTDFLALLMSWGAVYLQGRPPSARKTYGYNRAGVLAAFVNGLTLVLISFYIWYEAFKRLQTPVSVDAGIMIWVAAAGVVMNGAIALLLMRGHRDINLRSALLHEIGDTLVHGCGDRGRRGHRAYRPALDRSRAVGRHRRDDSVVVDRHHPREPEHSAGRHAQRHGPGSHPARASARYPESMRCTTCTCGALAAIPIRFPAM